MKKIFLIGICLFFIFLNPKSDAQFLPGTNIPLSEIDNAIEKWRSEDKKNQSSFENRYSKSRYSSSRYSSSSGSTYVRGYFRKDGTYVRSHYRRKRR